MNILKRILLVTAVLITAGLLFSCNDGAQAHDYYSVHLSERSIDFTEIGQSKKISAQVFKNYAEIDEVGEELSWSSTDENVAIYEGGQIIAVGFGSCSIVASYNGGTAVCAVNNPNPAPPLTITATSVNLENIGAKGHLIAYSNTNEDISSKIEWTTSNPSIAVCDDGIITAVGFGSCSVTAVHGSNTAICTVIVSNPLSPQIIMSKDRLSLNVGDMYMISAEPKNNAGAVTSFLSSDESVATCENGLIRAHKKGICLIIAVTDLGYCNYTIVSVGESKQSMPHEKYLNFEYRDLEKELHYVDAKNGALLSSAVVTSYEMRTQLLDDGRLVVEISLICVKTYDAAGINGKTPVSITPGLYREKDVLCDKKPYKVSDVSVGDTFKIQLSGFTVQTLTNGMQREFYLTFSAVTEG